MTSSNKGAMIMVCYAAKHNQLKLDRGNSGAILSCVTTLSSFFIGDIAMIIVEIWRPIKGYEGVYEASSFGRIRRLSGKDYRGRNWIGRILNPSISITTGRRKVTLSYKTQRSFNVATLICESFHGLRPKGKEVAHNDGNKLNDFAENLRWATHEENEKDKILHGTVALGIKNGKYTKPEATPRGEKHGRAKLKNSDVIAIREMYKTKNHSWRELAEMFNVSKTQIGYIVNLKVWRHLV